MLTVLDLLRLICGCMAAWLVLAALSWLLIRQAIRNAPEIHNWREDEPWNTP